MEGRSAPQEFHRRFEALKVADAERQALIKVKKAE